MEKPLSVTMTEIKTNIAKIINESGVPMYILEPIVRDIYEQICKVGNQQMEREAKEWEESQKEED